MLRIKRPRLFLCQHPPLPAIILLPRPFVQILNGLVCRLPEKLIRVGLIPKAIDGAVGILARTALIGFDCARAQRFRLHGLNKLFPRTRGNSFSLVVCCLRWDSESGGFSFPSQERNTFSRDSRF